MEFSLTIRLVHPAFLRFNIPQKRRKKINWKAITCHEVRGNIILKITYVNVL